MDWRCLVLYGKERIMKFTIKLLSVFVLTLATFSPQTTASAEANRFQGHSADAYFYTTDASGCIQTSVILELGEDILLSIQLFRYDICQNQPLIDAYGRKELTKSELKYSGNLDSATLRTTVPMTNADFDVSIDLTWIGTGEINKLQTHYNYSPSPGCHINLLLQEEYRSASASGTVSDGTTNFTPEPADQANLYFAKRTLTSQGCD
jgi:hypothetical protein